MIDEDLVPGRFGSDRPRRRVSRSQGRALPANGGEKQPLPWHRDEPRFVLPVVRETQHDRVGAEALEIETKRPIDGIDDDEERTLRWESPNRGGVFLRREADVRIALEERDQKCLLTRGIGDGEGRFHRRGLTLLGAVGHAPLERIGDGRGLAKRGCQGAREVARLQGGRSTPVSGILYRQDRRRDY